MSRNAKPRNEIEAQERERALGAIARMRRDKLSLRNAARASETTSDLVKKYVGSALRRNKSGRYRATLYDRIPRSLNFLILDRYVPITIRDSRTASKIAEHSNAVRKYVRTGDTSTLAQFKNKSFRTGGAVHRFVAEPDLLDRLADAGSLAGIETLYYARMAS